MVYTELTGLFKALLWLTFTFFYAFTFGGRIPYFIFYISIVVLALGFIWTLLNHRVSALCYIEAGSAQVGGKVRVVIEVQNSTGWPIPWVQYWVKMPGTFGFTDNLACYTFSLAPHEKKVSIDWVECKLRGVFPWGQGLIKTGDIFGIWGNARSTGDLRELVVYPEFRDLGNVLGMITGGDKPGGYHSAPKLERSGIDIVGVRKYDIGDAVSRIHWKASAKAQQLLVKEFQEQKYPDLLLCLDLNENNHAGRGPQGSGEKAVTLCASLACTGIQAGFGVGLLVLGKKPAVIPVGYGKGHFRLMLHNLVRVQQGKNCSVSDLANETALLNKSCRPVLVTGQLDEETAGFLLRLKARGQQGAVFFMKLETFGRTDLDRENRQKWVLALQNAGIPVFAVERDLDLRLAFRGVGYEVG